MKFPLAFAMFMAAAAAMAQTPDTALPAPPQDRQLPYTRSAEQPAIDKIKNGIAVYPGSRYGYVKGYRVRLSDTDLLRAEAIEKDGVVYVPGAFAALVGTNINPKPVPADLAAIADRWVYAPGEMTGGKVEFAAAAGVATIPVKDGTYYSLQDVAKAKGLQVTRMPNGVLYVGGEPPAAGENGATMLDDIVTLFDTPDKLANPDIATKSIPALTRQGKWTDHVKVTPEEVAILNGPETDWPTAPESEYDYSGFDAKLLGSKVPPPGVYPRVLFSPEDVPMLAARVKSTKIGQKSLIEMEYIFRHSWWDPSTSDGQVFQKLSTGDLAGLEWDAPPGTPLSNYPQMFKGEKPGVFNSHVAYVPECLTAMALYCLITNDDAHGHQVATAIANYFRLREKLLDEWLAISDSEFGSSYTRPDGTVVNLNGAGARTHWRNIHGLMANMNLGLSLDFAGKWMSADEKDSMRRIIAKATYGRRSYAQDAPVRFRDVNWMAWDLPHFLAVASIEGLPGFDPEAYASGAESVRAFCDWGIDNSGVIFESNGKTPGSLQFETLSMVALARRGENLFGHPHWRKLLEGQIQMTSPSGRVTVTNGTQYVPYSRQALSLHLVTEFKGFFPQSRLADYLITKSISAPGASTDEYLREWPQADFNPEIYRNAVGSLKRLRLPSVTYPGFTNALLYDGDAEPTTRADLRLPLDFSAPVHGVFSSYSDRTPEAAWMNMLVRPNHYLGAGHHHADAGMFHFSALGVDWFTQSPFSQEFAGKYFNLVQVDDKSEPAAIPGQILGYNGAAKYLASGFSRNVAAASADLTYAYTWRWMTQPPQIWSDELKSLGWEMDPTPRIEQIFAGAARYKMRPWWTNYTYSNYIPTSRAPFNPMEYVFRTTGLVRGTHPYGFIVDDLKKDDAEHLYQWAGMLNGGVWKAAVPNLPANEVALAYREGDPDINSRDAKPDITPQPGEPLLLVCGLGLKESGDPALPLAQVERAEGPKESKSGKGQYYDRLVINRRAQSVAFKVLLLPVKAGEELPRVGYDAGSNTATVQWGGQSDTLEFRQQQDKRTQLRFTRDNETVDTP